MNCPNCSSAERMIGLGMQDYSTVFPKPETDLEKVLLEHLYQLSGHAKNALEPSPVQTESSDE